MQFMIFIVVKFPIRPDKLDKWESVREDHTRGARSEEGCLFFGYSQSVDDPNEFVCVEAFRDGDAAVHHVNTQAFKDFVERMPDIVSTNPQIINMEIDHPGWGAMGEIAPRGA
jgi:quinol monooxygenase YgiN